MTDWTSAHAPTLDDIETLAREAFKGLPEEFRALTGEIVFMVQDFPGEDVIEDMELQSDFDILGLFSGPNLAARIALYLIPNRRIFETPVRDQV